MLLKRKKLPVAVLPAASVILCGALASACSTTHSVSSATGGADFAAPVRLMAEGEVINTPSIGYSAPSWYDVTGDGLEDLLVGQIEEGMIGVYPQKPDGTFAKRQWLQAEGEDVKLSSIW